MDRRRILITKQPRANVLLRNPLIDRQIALLSAHRNHKKINNFRKQLQKPPPIVLPALNETKTESSLPQRTVVYTNLDGLVNPVLHPLTPHAHATQDIIPLLSRCINNDPTITYRTVRRDLNIKKSVNENSEKKKETLLYIQKLVNDPVFRYTLSSETFISIMEIVACHIFRPKIRIPDVNEFAEGDKGYEIENWEHLNVFHKIMRSLMLEHANFAALLTDKLISAIIDNLNSPVKEEQRAFEETLKMIIDNYPTKKFSVINYMMLKLISYDNSYEKASQVAAILRLIYCYYVTLEPPIKQSYFQTFRSVFFPLFSTPYAYLFEKPLCDVSLFFEVQDPATTFWCLKYLTNHWPVQNTKKIALYLHHLTDLLPYLPDTLLSKAAPLVLHDFASVIGSPHVGNCVEALLYCDNEEFLQVFKNMPGLVQRILIPAADAACNSWKEDARAMAVSFRSKLSQFEHFRRNRNTINSAEIWSRIESMASI